MDDALLVRVLDRLTNGGEKLQAFFGGEIVLVAELGDGDALDQFHDEVGTAGAEMRNAECGAAFCPGALASLPAEA